MLREKIIHIEAEGRDFGKIFKITEMTAFRAEKWAARVLIVLLQSGLEMPDDVAKGGLAGVAALGATKLLNSKWQLKWELIEPLLDEMLTCISVIPNPDKEDYTRPLKQSAGDIEEVATILFMRKELLELHLGFSFAERLSTSASSQTNEMLSSVPMSQE